MEALFEFLRDNPFLLLFVTLALSVWIGRFSVQGYARSQRLRNGMPNILPKPRTNSLRCLVPRPWYGTLEHLDVTNRSCEIGLVIGDTRYWNKGLGTLVVHQLTTLAFTVYHMHRVYAVIQGGKLASMRCFAKAGFQHEGTLREARYVNGTFIALHYYAVLCWFLYEQQQTSWGLL